MDDGHAQSAARTLALPACEIDAAGLLLERLHEATPGGQICSAGLVASDRIESTDQLIGRADAALYEVKVAGRNRDRRHVGSY